MTWGTGPAVSEPARDMDGTLDALDERTRRTLADLAGAPRTFAQTTLGLLPARARTDLVALGIVVSRPLAGARRQGEPPLARMELTDWGVRVIDACAQAEAPEPVR